MQSFGELTGTCWFLKPFGAHVVWGGGKGGGSSAPPPAPDPAETTAADAAANRLTSFRPDGTLAIEYGYLDRDSGQFVAGAPEESDLPQYAVRSFENDFERGIRETSESAATSLATQFGQDVQNFGAAPTYDPNATSIAETIYNRSADLARDDIELSRRRLDNNLQARGLAPGSEAYNRAIREADETEQQTWATLAQDATLAAQGEARSDYATAEAERANRLNEAAGLIGGAYAPGAVQTPTGGAPLSPSSQYWNNYNAQMSAYNADQQRRAAAGASAGSAIGGVASIAGGLLGKSSRKFKTEIGPYCGASAVEAVRGAPVLRWRYKDDPDQLEHIGPMAEDFRDSTGLGDGVFINILDMCGVLWAANQQLLRRVERLEREQRRAA